MKLLICLVILSVASILMRLYEKMEEHEAEERLEAEYYLAQDRYSKGSGSAA